MNRCNALTTKKVRCLLNTAPNSNFCHRHKKLVDAGREVGVFQNNVQNIQQNDNQHNNLNNQEIDRVVQVQIQGNLRIHKGNAKNNKKSKKLVKDDFKEVNVKEKKEVIEPFFLSEENECKCCFEKFSPSEVVMCTGTNQKYQHVVCRDCLKGYMDSVLNEKKSVGCMMSCEGCHGRYNDFEVKMILDDDHYKKYIESTSVEEAVSFSKIIDNYFTCPFCSKYGVEIDNVERLDLKYLSVRCQQCSKSWCIKCRNEGHVPDPCGKLRKSDDNTIRKAVELTIDDAMIHKCPKCFTKYNKEDGCNLMTCNSCHSYSCYVCGIHIVPRNGVKYWHFKGSGTADKDAVCELYNNKTGGTAEEIKKSNVKFNTGRVIESLQNLININMDNPEIAKKLYDFIVSKEYKIKKYTIIVPPKPKEVPIENKIEKIESKSEKTVNEQVAVTEEEEQYLMQAMKYHYKVQEELNKYVNTTKKPVPAGYEKYLEPFDPQNPVMIDPTNNQNNQENQTNKSKKTKKSKKSKKECLIM